MKNTVSDRRSIRFFIRGLRIMSSQRFMNVIMPNGKNSRRNSWCDAWPYMLVASRASASASRAAGYRTRRQRSAMLARLMPSHAPVPKNATVASSVPFAK